MTFIPKHPTELVAEALNRFGPQMDTPEARTGAERFIRDTLASIEEQGFLRSVPWFIHISLDRDDQLHFIVVPEPLMNRATRHLESDDCHVLIDVATNVTTETESLLSGIADHALNVEKHLNKHNRN